MEQWSSESRSLILMPFKYRDDGLVELITESNLEDTTPTQLYRLVFESIYTNRKFIELFEKSLGTPVNFNRPQLDLYLECVRLKREIGGLLRTYKLLKLRDNLVLHRLDETCIIALI